MKIHTKTILTIFGVYIGIWVYNCLQIRKIIKEQKKEDLKEAQELLNKLTGNNLNVLKDE